jgi:hypothetical protein
MVYFLVGNVSIMKPSNLLSAGLLFYLLFMPLFAFLGDLRIECELSGGVNCVEYGYMQGIATAGMVFGILLSVGGAYKIRTLSKGGKKKSGGLWFAYEGDGEDPSVEYSEDGYWKLIDEEWVPTEKQMSAINSGAVIQEIKP